MYCYFILCNLSSPSQSPHALCVVGILHKDSYYYYYYNVVLSLGKTGAQEKDLMDSDGEEENETQRVIFV